MVEPDHPGISIARQCDLLGLSRSGFYYQPKGESALNLHLMRLLDEQYTRTPFYGSPKMTIWLWAQGYGVNHKRVERLMSRLGLQAICPRPATSRSHPQHRVYPYLLRDVMVDHADQVFCARHMSTCARSPADVDICRARSADLPRNSLPGI